MQVTLQPLLGPVQGYRALAPVEAIIAKMERTQGTVLDWRSTSFWRRSGFVRSWHAFKHREQMNVDNQTLLEATSRDECAPFLNPAAANALPCANSGLHAVIVRLPIWDSMTFHRHLWTWDQACSWPDRAAVTRDPETGRPVPGGEGGFRAAAGALAAAGRAGRPLLQPQVLTGTLSSRCFSQAVPVISCCSNADAG